MERSLDSTVPGFGHSVIRGLVTTGQWSAVSPAVWARESKYKIYSVNIEVTQITQTLMFSKDSFHMPSGIALLEFGPDCWQIVKMTVEYRSRLTSRRGYAAKAS